MVAVLAAIVLLDALLVAHAFGLDLRLTAAIVAWTHALVVAAAGTAALL